MQIKALEFIKNTVNLITIGMILAHSNNDGNADNSLYKSIHIPNLWWSQINNNNNNNNNN